MRIRKSIISIILTAALLICSMTVPVYAEDIESVEMDLPKVDTIETEMPVVNIDGTKEDEAIEFISSDGEVISDSDEQTSIVEPYSADSANAVQERSGLELKVTYDKPIRCGKETTFTLEASGGSGDYEYRIHSLMTSELVSVYDVSISSNSPYTKNNQWKFTFYASGTYYIRFSVRDINTNLTANTGLFEYPLVIEDPAYPTLEQRVDTITQECIQACGSQATDFDKALWLHDWIINHATYDDDLKYCSAEGVLARGTGTCEAYHRAYVMLLNKMGIQTGRIEGNGHVWTAVKLDGKWCHVDTTWDDPVSGTNDAQHMYFGLDDKIIGLVHSDHQSPTPGYEAGTSSLENNYFIKTGNIKKWSDPYIDQIKQKLADGEALIQFSIPYYAVNGSYHHTNVIYNLVAYQLSKENWGGINVDFSFDKASYGANGGVNGNLICRVNNRLIIEKNADESVMTIRLVSDTLSSNATVSFPVWGEAGGQNDIVWYTGRKTGEGTYEATVPISAHKETGKYNIHVYVNENGKQIGIAKGETTITGITADEVVCNESKSSKKDGKYRVEIKNLSSPSNISNVQIPVWSDTNGQDDIRWYTARKDGDVWYIDVELKYHKYDAGLYHAHTYVTDVRGIMQGVGITSFTAEKMDVNQLQIEKNAEESVLTVRLTNATVNSATISIPVWGEAGGQNDIVWYTGRKTGEGTYEATVPISAHKETGKYNIHVYAVQDGKQIGIATGETTITGITADEVICNESKSSKEDGKYRIEIKNLSSPSNISNVQIPVWSDANGQDDIRWYTARKDGDVWYIDVELKYHKYDAGLYHAHTYVTDMRGIMQGVGIISFTAEKMDVNQLQIEKNAQESVLTVRLTNAMVNSATISIPVWGEAGGQNDIVWYTGRKTGEGTYEVTVPVSAHKETGKYNIHVYAVRDGKQVGIAKGETTITGITADGVVCNESKSSKKDGKYRIEVKNVSSPSNISNVQIPVWSDANGQDDIRWYTARKDGDIWYVDVEIYNHKFDSGVYHAHVYATDIRGIMQGVGKVDFEAEKIERNDLQISLDKEQRYMTIFLNAATTDGTVLFPVWGKENGQNDIVWYSGMRIAPYTYKVVVDISRHKEIGEYIVHVYSQTSGTLSFLNAGNVIVEGISDAQTEIIADRDTATIEVKISDIAGPSNIERVMVPT